MLQEFDGVPQGYLESRMRSLMIANHQSPAAKAARSASVGTAASARAAAAKDGPGPGVSLRGREAASAAIKCTHG
jgi:hypothetical protein